MSFRTHAHGYPGGPIRINVFRNHAMAPGGLNDCVDVTFCVSPEAAKKLRDQLDRAIADCEKDPNDG